MATKYHINLLQADLIPPKPWLTFSKMLSIWAVALVLMLAAIVVSQQYLSSLKNHHQQLVSIKNQQQQKQAQLEKQIQARTTDTKLDEQLLKLKTLVKYKSALHGKLTNQSSAYVKGFSGAMTELAAHHHRDISLQSVSILPNNMIFRGVAKTPDAVPNWLAGFNQSTLLAGMTFGHFKLDEHDGSLTAFVVSTVVPQETSAGVENGQ